MNRIDEMLVLYSEISGMEIAAHMLKKKIETRKRKLAKLLKENGYGHGYFEEFRDGSFEIAITEEGARALSIGDDRGVLERNYCDGANATEDYRNYYCGGR